ncbi:GNAT family N-acetyltransferase [Amycolatopsis samaneae]|uniref:GNAT family N-acetyltransferase n=1 Tax=Amycolatopsis samaneae TaxID=664691 RepID=A0ABW5GH53_9PSEU
MSVPELVTARLRLRALTEADTAAAARVFADPEMSRFLVHDFTDPRQLRAMMDRRLSYDGPAGQGHWAIDRDGEFVGLAHLSPSRRLPGGVTSIGYYLAREHGGQGLATEAARALLDHGFGTLGLPAVWALAREDHAASRKVLRRLGFLDVGGHEYEGMPHRVFAALPSAHGRPHHLELWVPDLARAERSWGWLLTALGWREYQRWSAGVSWRLGATYLVVERSPALSGTAHERTRPGLNHLALHVATRDGVDALAAGSAAHGWRPLFADRYPHAGGDEHYAAYLENEDGFEVELVAIE